jgi:predicted RNA-binding protein with PIN domain
VLLIDGYNLLHSLAHGRATSDARDRLLALLEAWCRQEGQRARIVFDATGGMRRKEERGPLEIRSVARGRTADDEILEILASTSDRTAYTLVSNDLALVKPAQKRQIAVLSCEEFARQLARKPGTSEKQEGASGPEVDYWMREFGLEE